MTDNPRHNAPSDAHLIQRQELADLLFRGIKYFRELPDGYAMGYSNVPQWTTRIAEFIKLEQIAYTDFRFEMIFEAENQLVWMHWRGDLHFIKEEMLRLSPRSHPIGRITLLKDEPLVSVIVAVRHENENIRGVLGTIFEQVRPPVEIIVVDSQESGKIWRAVEGMQDRRVKAINTVNQPPYERGVIESQGGIVVFMKSNMPPVLLSHMIEKMDEYDIVIGSRYVENGVDDRTEAETHYTQRFNRVARRLLGPAILDYDSTYVMIRRVVLNKTPLHLDGTNGLFTGFFYRAQRRGLRICELPCRYFADEDSNFGTFLKDMMRLLRMRFST